ncbi:hypothetical protein [Lichenifustis flavocetrariae]|uniref:Uncharacterized protein n=1 Tax=Lichenifustis flavocetrariae TaxID=2949735 RepID=A0AA41Z4S8_9HYPH|nr:hypothetical protein [Lichenifustis flavocetrariae]MCW6512795.1 hypothetical protein [Lichenifustis flavocetrariae]
MRYVAESARKSPCRDSEFRHESKLAYRAIAHHADSERGTDRWFASDRADPGGPTVLPPVTAGNGAGSRPDDPMVPIHLTRLTMKSTADSRTFRFLLIETEPRSNANGEFVVAAMTAAFPGSHTFRKAFCKRHEISPRWWATRRARLLGDCELGFKVVAPTTVTAHNRQEVREILGAGIFNSIGGEEALRFLSPEPRVAPLLTTISVPVDLSADTDLMASHDPTFGSF